jgi:hypothetical protein
MGANADFLTGVIKQFHYYKMLGEKTIDQLPLDKLSWQFNPESNSIAIIVNHLHGNMMSRFTNFLSEDGEKTWRNREAEFDISIETKDTLVQKWNAGWSCLFDCLEKLDEVDLSKEVYIRNMGHSVLHAINRQLAHYSYHIGQIVYIGRMLVGANWQSLSIPRGGTDLYNAEKFAREKGTQHFTDEFLKSK